MASNRSGDLRGFMELIGVTSGITYRPFKGRQFAEIVFCAISSDQQVRGYGAHLMSHLKVSEIFLFVHPNG